MTNITPGKLPWGDDNFSFIKRFGGSCSDKVKDGVFFCDLGVVVDRSSWDINCRPSLKII